MGTKVKLVLAALLGLLVAVSAFYLSKTASKKVAMRAVEKPNVGEIKKQEPMGKQGEGTHGASTGELSIPPSEVPKAPEAPSGHAEAAKKEEKSLDEQLSDIDFTDRESKLRGNELVLKNAKKENIKTMEQLEAATNEAKRKRELEESVKEWIKRND